ncbi:uncharacterized protein N7483_011040 [Penicillium malachiteum]|uniref:uncharacterized protein n=1 Tax=Penicillium malachiteum TaxID=1324776 RepID=UPI0025489E77|nr:uncharacterized protein N7483_011040 [Penicillium malachiteum]KAJ5713859.1 hypothetical protein N7483_011040 [Penicillium malachiteum]
MPGMQQWSPNPKRVHVAQELDAQTPSECPTTGSKVGIIEDLQQRMAKLENLLAVRPHAGNFGPMRDVPVQESWPRPSISHSSSPYLGTLVVKGERSRWHGMNNRITLLNQFAEAKTFINQSLKDPGLVGLAKEVQFLKSRSQSSNDSPESISGLESFPELQNLLGSLPPKPVTDRLLDVYTKNFERNLRILHVPSFLRHYKTFWATTDHEPSFLSMFVPILTAILSISVVIETEPFNMEYSSSWNYLKQHAVASVQAWMRKLPRKPRTDLATLQVGVLLLLARQLRSVPAEELWKESGLLMRSAMVMGLHVNVTLSPSKSLTVFQAELRRRLWITIVEMDLQTSIAAGMPVLTPALEFSPLTPSNLNDADFSDTSPELPTPKPLDVETDTLPQILLANSLAKRIRIMGPMQHTTPKETMDERLKESEDIEEILQHIPPFLHPDYDSESADLSSVLNRVLLDIHIRRPLICLLRPVTSSDNQDEPSFSGIQRMCLESSITILSYQDLFDPNVVDPDTPGSNTYWRIFQTFCQNDILWAALGVCEYLKHTNQHSSAPSPSNLNDSLTDGSSKASKIPATNNLVHNKASLTRLVENTLDSLTRRIGEKGTNMKDVLLLSVVLQSVRSRGPSDQKERRMSQGAKKALSVCRQNLLSSANETIVDSYSDNAVSQMVCLPPSKSILILTFLVH